MEAKKTLYNLKLEQHYFHFIVLGNVASLSLVDCWKHIGKVRRTQSPIVSHDGFEIEHRVLNSDEPYSRSDIAASVRGDSKGPFPYDVFAMKVRTKRNAYIVAAFPFAALARDTVGTLRRAVSARKRVDFQKANVASLIGQADNGIVADDFRAGVVGIQVASKGDPDLRSVCLGGEHPLKSSLYKEFLQTQIEKEGKKFRIEHCILACELDQPRDELSDHGRTTPTLRSRARIDTFGNFKFYIHLGGANLIVIPRLLQVLDGLKCLDRVAINPLLRYSEEEQT